MSDPRTAEQSGTSRLPIFLLLAVLLVSATLLLGQAFEAAGIEKWFDRDQYQDRQVHKVSSLDELVEDFETQHNLWMPLAPPSTNFFGWTQVSTPDPMLFNPAGFPDDFVKGLVPVYRDGVVTYPVFVLEDADTRERVFRNVYGEVLAKTPVPPDYDPLWCLAEITFNPR